MYTAKSGLAHLYLPENESPRSFPLRKKSLTNKKWGIIEICQKKNRVQKNHNKGRDRRSQELASRRAGQQCVYLFISTIYRVYRETLMEYVSVFNATS